MRVEWPGAGTSRYYERANSVVGAAASVDGGVFMHSPLWSRLLRHNLITVHPLGGCVMADRAEDGVVDDRGRVFSGSEGAAVHDGLLVWDGSILPRPLGVNPLLTISALTERAAFALAATHGWKIDETSPVPPAGRRRTAPSARPARHALYRADGRVLVGGDGAGDGAGDADDLAHYEQAAPAGEAADPPWRSS